MSEDVTDERGRVPLVARPPRCLARVWRRLATVGVGRAGHVGSRGPATFTEAVGLTVSPWSASVRLVPKMPPRWGGSWSLLGLPVTEVRFLTVLGSGDVMIGHLRFRLGRGSGRYCSATRWVPGRLTAISSPRMTAARWWR